MAQLILPTQDAQATFGSRAWRLDNLYRIVNKQGDVVPFKLNWSQRKFLREMHSRNIILKARQRGFSTLIDLMILDACLFNSNLRGGIVADSLPNASTLLATKVYFPYQNLSPLVAQELPPLKTENISTAAWDNNSSIDTGVSMRGGTLQWLHVSELGKIAAKHPEKAREIRTGALNTLPLGAMGFVESTAEGREGVFYEMCMAAMAHTGDLTAMDWKFHFFPWWEDSDYQLEAVVHIDDKMREYFAKLTLEGIHLTRQQKAWYVKKSFEQGPDMKREYPSTPLEAFESTREGAYYVQQLAKAKEDGRIGSFPPLPGIPVHTFWDIGHSDSTAIWFVQFKDGWARVIDYYENSGEQVMHYVNVVRGKRYHYAMDGQGRAICYMPHDIKAEIWGLEHTRVEQLTAAGFAVEIAPSLSEMDGIDAARLFLERCQFNADPTEQGLQCLRNFRKDWNEKTGDWKSTPRKDWTNHGADAFRYLVVSYQGRLQHKEKPKPDPTPKGIEAQKVEALFLRRERAPTERI